MCNQFAYSSEATVAYLSKALLPAKPKVEEQTYGCQMPLTRSASCVDCKAASVVMNCARHMKACAGPAWLPCDSCDRHLCWDHMNDCYCQSNEAKFEREQEIEREKQRERETEKQRKRD